MEKLSIDSQRLAWFEALLDPCHVERCPVPVKVLGYGEMSAVFQFEDDKDVAYKRLPPFTQREAATRYLQQYDEYCQLLRDAGLTLPADGAALIPRDDNTYVLYLAQQCVPGHRFCHKLLDSLARHRVELMFERIAEAIDQLWSFTPPSGISQVALDGQLSNWVWLSGDQLLYIDTSTPLYRRDGKEQLDPELFLKTAPSFLRWIIRWLFLQEVLDRYYDRRAVFVDLIANLHKEQHPDLIPLALEIYNEHLPEEAAPITETEVTRYYQEDKRIWTLFLAFRRLDRWIKTRILGQRYELLLPGDIQR